MRSLLGRFHRPMSRGLVNNMLTMNNLGDGSTLNLDFTTMGGVLDPRLTFTRSTTATYINSSGYVTSAAINAPRFDYSPTNIGQPRGLLVEGQTQNALFYSQDVTQASRWTIQAFGSGSYTTVSTTGGTAPDNTNTANLLTEGTGSFSRSIYQAVSMAIGTHTVSLFVKAGSGNARYMRLVLASAAGNFVYVTVNLANGAVTQTAAAVGTATAASATVTSYTGGWYRISLTGTFTAATNFCFIVPSDSATPAVNTGDYGRYDYVGTGASFSLWGCQVEAGSGASSYIVTGASQVTRNRDTAVMSDISALNCTNAAGTLFADFTNNNENANYAGSIAFNNGANYAQRFRLGVGSLLVSYFQTNGITGLGSNLFGARTSFARAKAASSYSFDGTTTTTLMSMNGAAASVTPSSSAAASVSIPTNLSLNSDNSSGALDYVSMTIRSIKYFPTAKSLVDMNGLTT